MCVSCQLQLPVGLLLAGLSGRKICAAAQARHPLPPSLREDWADREIRASAGGPCPAPALCFCLVITRENRSGSSCVYFGKCQQRPTCGVVVVFVLKPEGLAKEDNGERKIRSHRSQASAVTPAPSTWQPRIWGAYCGLAAPHILFCT